MPETFNMSEQDPSGTLDLESAVNAMHRNNGFELSTDNFVGSMDGRWVMPTNTGWSLTVYNFSGSVMLLDQGGWIATGQAKGKSSASREIDMAWYIGYDPADHRITWTVWGQTQVFNSVLDAKSPVTYQFNPDTKKFLVLVRETRPFGTVNIAKGSFLQAIVT